MHRIQSLVHHLVRAARTNATSTRTAHGASCAFHNSVLSLALIAIIFLTEVAHDELQLSLDCSWYSAVGFLHVLVEFGEDSWKKDATTRSFGSKWCQTVDCGEEVSVKAM